MAITFHKLMETPLSNTPTGKEFTEKWNVKVDDPLTPNTVIENQPEFPSRFSVHPERPEFWCITSDLDQPKDTPDIRPLTVRWANTIPLAFLVDGKPKFDDDPTKRPAEITWGVTVIKRTLRLAYKEKQAYDPTKAPPEPTVPIITTAGEPIFLEEEDEVRTMSFSKNVVQLPKFMAKAGMYVNSDRVKLAGITYEPLQLLARQLLVSPVKFSHGKAYYEFTWQWHVAPEKDGWIAKRRNAGFHEKVTVYRFPNGAVSPTPVPGGFSFTVLRPIKIGPKHDLHYPSSPVLLTPEGRAYRAKGPNDLTDSPTTNTGEIMSVESTGGSGISDEEWAAAELKFYTKLMIPFNKYFPIR